MNRSDELKRAICGLTVVTETSAGLALTLPVVYPGGDLVSVVVAYRDAVALVHDESNGMLELEQAGSPVSSAVQVRLRKIAARYGCTIADNRVQREAPADKAAMAAMFVANASKAISEVFLEIRHRAESEFRERVAEKVRQIAGSRVRHDQQFTGASGRKYRVHNVVLDAKLKKPIAFVEPFANRQSLPLHVIEIRDLSNLDVKKVAVYDDQSDLRKEDVKLLHQQVGNVTSYNRSDRPLRQLVAN